VASDGKILRSDAPLVPTEDCLFQVQEKGLLKTFSHSGSTGLLAIFHACDSETESTEWKASDISIFKEMADDKRFVAWDYKEQKALEIDLNSTYELELDRMGVKLFWVTPLTNGIAPLGLLNKYNGPAAVTEVKNTDESVQIHATDGGPFGIYVTTSVKSISVNDTEIEFNTDNNLIRIDLPLGQENIITISK
jgi:hypothetical protein